MIDPLRLNVNRSRSFSAGNGTDKILYGRTADEIVPAASRPRLQRQRSLKMFHVGGSNKRLSWSEYRSGSGGGSLKLSQAKAKKLLEECAHVSDWDEATILTTADDVPVKNHKGPLSIFNYEILLLIFSIFFETNRKDVAFEPTFP